MKPKDPYGEIGAAVRAAFPIAHFAAPEGDGDPAVSLALRPGPDHIATWRDIRIEDLDSGLPRLTVDLAAFGGPSFTVRFAPDAVRALVDALAGLAEPAPGEVRVLIRGSAEDVAKALAEYRGGGR